MLMSEKGVIYVVTGPKESYWREAMLSIESFKKFNPDIPITIFTDRIRSIKFQGVNVVKIPEEPKLSFYDKWIGIKNSPYYKTLYLDTDTYVCDNLSEIFVLLDNFSLLICYDVTYYKQYCIKQEKMYGIPLSFPIPQAGVIAFRKDETFLNFLALWEEVFSNEIQTKAGVSDDQAALRIALFKDKSLRFMILPYEYNMRLSGPVYFMTAPKIFHARRDKLFFEKLAQKMRRDYGVRRVYIPRLGILASPRDMFRSAIRNLMEKFWVR